MLKYFAVAYSIFLSGITYAKQVNGSIEITPIAPNLYLHTSYKAINKRLLSANGLIFIDDKSAYLIDTPWNESNMNHLLSWIKRNGLKLKAAIVTHSHEDRTAGLGFLNQHGYTTYASTVTNSLLKKRGQPVANHSFSANMIKLADEQIEVYFPGEGHTADNVVVWLPTNNALFGGCLIRDVKSNTLGWLGDAKINKWHQSVTNVVQRYPTASIVVPGHGKIGGQSLLTHTLGLARAAKSN